MGSSHCRQTLGLDHPANASETTLMRDRSGINAPSLVLEQANSHILHPVQFSELIINTPIMFPPRFNRLHPLGLCLESSITDSGNLFHFRKDRPTTLNSNIQIPNSKQSANPNFQNSKQKHSEGSALVLHTFLFWSFVFLPASGW